MNLIAGVRWRQGDAVIYAQAGDLDLHRNGHVVIQAEKGQELAWVAKEPKELVDCGPGEETGARRLRKATSSDIGRLAQNRESEQGAFKLARTKTRE